MRRKNAAVLMTAVIIGGLLTSCGSAYNNANGKNSDNTVETQTTLRTVVNGETKTDGNNVKTADKETRDFTQEVTSEENNLTDSDIAGNTEASEQQAFDDLSQADDYKNNSGQKSGEDSGSGDDYQNSDGESYGDGDSSDNSEETDIPSASEDVNSDYNLLARAQINTVTYSAYANEVLRLVNIERTNVGVAPLVLDEALCNAANMRAIEMDCTGVFGHKRPNDHSCFEVYDICNVEWQNACGENFAAADLAEAQELFTTGQTAMYYIGSWEMSAMLDKSLSDDMKGKIDYFTLPEMREGTTNANQINVAGGTPMCFSAEKWDEQTEQLILYYCQYMGDYQSQYEFTPAKGYEAPKGETEHDQQIIDRIAEDMANVEGVIRLYDLEFDPTTNTNNGPLAVSLALNDITPEEFCAAVDESVEQNAADWFDDVAEELLKAEE